MVSARIPLSGVSTPGGLLQVTGLPYPCESVLTYNSTAMIVNCTTTPANNGLYISVIQSGASNVQIYTSGFQNAGDKIETGCSLYVQIQYLTT